LQRLDSFEGIAILTTNLDGAIDPAFKRWMSLRLQFPFPDAAMRQRLWAAHIPARAPVAGDFAELARRFPLSGGYIRNSALRAAFLAAQERRPLGHDHRCARSRSSIASSASSPPTAAWSERRRMVH
jgi:SpoVK/Ycf46/Vps4 family AAA+-type ATPase